MLNILSRVVKTFKGRTVAGASYEPCEVSINHRGVGIQCGYVVTMTSGDNRTSFEVVAAPDEIACAALNKYIRASIKKFYDHNFNAGKIRFEHEISTWCALNIGTVALKGLNGGILRADHCYIKATSTEVSGVTCIRVALCKNQEEVAVFNAKQLQQWLIEHSNTVIYSTLQTQALENALARHKSMTLARRLSITDNITIMTMTERFKERLNVLLDDEMVFDKDGMYIENEELNLISA